MQLRTGDPGRSSSSGSPSAPYLMTVPESHLAPTGHSASNAADRTTVSAFAADSPSSSKYEMIRSTETESDPRSDIRSRSKLTEPPSHRLRPPTGQGPGAAGSPSVSADHDSPWSILSVRAQRARERAARVSGERRARLPARVRRIRRNGHLTVVSVG
ncbi:hypothetical protein G419_20790 [Rhodococcus triatomae BKS 15-14]|nr:hypothetical protein G419_20790 [Rhodococcus triatomae BKS 15-14]